MRSFLHTSAPLCVDASRTDLARQARKINIVRKEERRAKAIANRPNIVTGTRPGEETKWDNCDLAKILVNEEDLVSSTELVPTTRAIGAVHLPKTMAYGIGEAEKRLLFDDLPMLSAEATVLASGAHTSPETLRRMHEDGLQRERAKVNMFAKVVDLRNANAGGIAYENRRRIIAAFSTPENPFDPGRTEVQGMHQSFLDKCGSSN